MSFRDLFLVAACIGWVGACVGDSDPPIDSGIDSNANDTSTSDTNAGDACVPGCANATTLRSCTQADQACALGCVTTGTPHCAVLQPASPVSAADLGAQGVSDLVFSKIATIHTDTGAIDGIRAANADPNTYEVVSGIGFHLFAGSNVGVFTVKTLTINDTIVAVARGNAALAIVASDTIDLKGTLDARGYTSTGSLCGATPPSAVGPGGTAASQFAGNPGVGPGGGQGADLGGGGGGGFGGKGGDGQHETTEGSPNSAGGAVVQFATPISGGFAGGTNGAAQGGGGGGGVQLVAGNEIRVGGGANPGGVNVGGCGGFGGSNSSFPKTGGGGAGSGGAILLQSPTVTMLSTGVLAANGGAGGSGGGFGAAGLFSDKPALPTAVNGTTTKGPGGPGGAGAVLNGSDAGPPITSSLGGGGGGAVGRIRIDNASGTLTPTSGAILSPGLGTTATTTTKVTSS